MSFDLLILLLPLQLNTVYMALYNRHSSLTTKFNEIRVTDSQSAFNAFSHWAIDAFSI